MINKEQVSTLCEDALANTDRFLVEVKVKPNNVERVLMGSFGCVEDGSPVAEICGQGRGGEDERDGQDARQVSELRC